MTSRQRLLTCLRGEIPDCVPVMPDTSNMIPARLTGKPFWDLYLYNDPPIWEAYIACAKHFDVDALMDGYCPLVFPEEVPDGPQWERAIVHRSDERIITQASHVHRGRRQWAKTVDVYYVADPPTRGVDPAKAGLPAEPQAWEPLEGVREVDRGPANLARAKRLMGDQGLVGVFAGAGTNAVGNIEGMWRYFDHPEDRKAWAHRRIEAVEARFDRIMRMDEKPDFLCVGGSGTLIWQTPEIFREIALPAVKRAIDLATDAGFTTHVHSCGPERELVRIMAEETDLTVIDPLEPPPMGDCDLAELKRLYGDRIVLKGNLHTTNVMLRGTPETVAAASRRAIDDAAEGGRFILSTGDQCGRDTPDENLRAMVETARTYGRY